MNQNDGLKLTTITDRIGDEDSARKLYESIRWPDGPVCPHCGEINNAGQLQARPLERVVKLFRAAQLALAHPPQSG